MDQVAHVGTPARQMLRTVPGSQVFGAVEDSSIRELPAQALAV